MIHKIENYSARLTTIDLGEREMEVHYRPLIEKVVISRHDADELHRSLLLIAKHHPIVVVFEPYEKERYL